MKSIGRLLNDLANPDNIPRFFSLVLGIVLIVGFVMPLALNDHQIYPRPEPQSQINSGDPLAPYDRGGTVIADWGLNGNFLLEPGIIKSQYPQFSAQAGKVTGYLSPMAISVKNTTLYFGTSIYSSPGGLIDEILYYSRGFDTILESSILMMAFVVASFIALQFTMRREEE
ncbi:MULTISPECIES: EhaF family protein [Methanobacterium]|jgi:energy-converting hydrogenase A subunit F|uniref:EhaF family protein n=1 Tax=Methanobacterium veterum TaxID=408577 RepID=A0A9E5DKE7_9EURY|nr:MULTISPECIES: EhaF family protein [Methanobacterium]MCZ3367227.1 EhaF family protein [Methanobacterium veterum]MCZ3373625.1 EhaF family protein [Methanobacterium veterum]